VKKKDVDPKALDALERRLVGVRERRNIRRSMEAWVRYKGFKPAAHHLLIIRECEAFLDDPDLDVLLLHAPPGSAKSTYISHLLPPSYFAKYPGRNILFATHSGDFAQRWGRKVRGEITNEGEVLGISISPTNAAADQFALKEGGEFYAVGAGVGIAGFRADLGLCDDLFGNREDAWSNTVRQKRWDWYVDDFSPRLKPGAKRILMNTRWHELDVAGRIAAQIESGQVRGKIINIPAIAGDDDPVGREPGAYLWDEDPEYAYGDFLRSRQRECSPMMWAALYQQRPAPEDGDYFKADWIKTYDVVPDPRTLRLYGASDFAVTSDAGDYTVHGVGGIDPTGKLYLLDLWRKQSSSDVWVESLCDLILKWHPMEWALEKGQITSGVGPYLDRRQTERRAYCVKTAFPTRGDKSVRAQSIRGYIERHGLWVDANAPWYAALRAEMLGFPAGRNDDMVDMLGLLGQLMDKMLRGKALRPLVPLSPKDRWDKVFNADDDNEYGWKAA
jgi:predicted phage terminase large subunit-like protein